MEINDAIGGGLSIRSNTDCRKAFTAVVGSGEGDEVVVGRGVGVVVCFGTEATTGVGDRGRPTNPWTAVATNDGKSIGGFEVEFATVGLAITVAAVSGGELGVGLGTSVGV